MIFGLLAYRIIITSPDLGIIDTFINELKKRIKIV